MGYRDETDMGGVGQAFLTTHWSLIGDIQSDDERNRALIGLLLDRYWKPVYFYLRRKGYDNEQAKDLTQGFFHEVVLNRDLIRRADPSKGRFRTLLLHALSQFLIDQRHMHAAKKRIPRDKLVSLDSVDPYVLPQAVSELTPEDSYNYGWMSAMLDHILSEVETRCTEQGMQTHWLLFYERVVRPILEDVAAPALTDLCHKHGIEREKKASNMIITVKRCFRAALKQYIHTTVMREEDVPRELAEITRFFPSDGAASPDELGFNSEGL